MRLASRPSARQAVAASAPQAAAHEHQRKLARDELVESEPLPRGAVWPGRFDLARLVDQPQRLREARPAACGQDIGRKPFRQVGTPLQRRRHGPPHHLRREPGGEAVDRLEQRQLARMLRVEHIFGMRDLRAHVEPRDLAAHDPPRAERKDLLQPVGARIEIDELDRRVPLRQDDAPRRRRARPRLLVPLHDALDRDIAGWRQLIERRPVAPVDETVRQMEQQIPDYRRPHPAPTARAISASMREPTPGSDVGRRRAG